MHECPALHSLTANPIQVKDRLDYFGAIYDNEETMDGELE